MKLKKGKCIYVIYNPLVDILKIGVSENVHTRFSCLETQCGMKLELLYHTFPIYNYASIEKQCHDNFEKERGIGEWFKIESSKVIEYIKSISYKFIYDDIYKQCSEEISISAIARNFNVSRAAIIKHMFRYNSDSKKGFDTQEFKTVMDNSNFPPDIEISNDPDYIILKDIPVKAIKIKEGIYRLDDIYYTKIYALKSWNTRQYKSLELAEKFISGIKEKQLFLKPKI